MRRPSVAQRRAKPPAIGRKSHRVVLCTAKDVVDESGQLRLARESAIEQWAEIVESRGSLFNREGVPVREARDQRSHRVTVGIIPGIEISAAAWVFESRSLLSPRWFKVLDVSETDEIGGYGRHWVLNCRLVERSDAALKPTEPAPEPAQVARATTALPGNF